MLSIIRAILRICNHFFAFIALLTLDHKMPKKPKTYIVRESRCQGKSW